MFTTAEEIALVCETRTALMHSSSYIRHCAKLCRSLWSCVAIHDRDLDWSQSRRRWPTSSFAQTKNDLARSMPDSVPYQIAFTMGVRTDTSNGTDESNKFWLMAGSKFRQARSILITAPPACTTKYKCAHLMLLEQLDRMHYMPRLEQLVLKKVEHENLLGWTSNASCCIDHSNVFLDLHTIRNLSMTIPFAFADMFQRKYVLTALDLDYQSSAVIQLFKEIPLLEQLMWRRYNTPTTPNTTSVLLTKLKHITIEYVGALPPISAPGLVSLTILDTSNSFTATEFANLTGHHSPLHTLADLNLGSNPITNYDLNIIIDCCPDAASIVVTSTFQIRTDFLRAMGDRIMDYYCFGGPPILRVGVASSYNPNNLAESRAYKRLLSMCRYESPSYMRVCPNPVRVGIPSGNIRFDRLSDFQQDNQLANSFVVIRRLPPYADLKYILVLNDVNAATTCVRRGIKAHGKYLTAKMLK